MSTEDDPFGSGFAISDEFFGDTVDPTTIDQEGYQCGV